MWTPWVKTSCIKLKSVFTMRERCRSPHAIYIIHSFSSFFKKKEKKNKKIWFCSKNPPKKTNSPHQKPWFIKNSPFKPSFWKLYTVSLWWTDVRRSASFSRFFDFSAPIFSVFRPKHKKSSRFQRTDQTFKNKVSECFSPHYGNKPLMTSASISRCNATTYAPIRSVQCFSWAVS